jgi:regulator of sirC expression with transglutaminase-like and TPR domain
MEALIEEEQQLLTPPSQMDAILSLLDDPDPVVQDAIRARLLELGDTAAPALRLASASDDDLVRLNADAALREIGLGRFRAEIEDVIDSHPSGDDIDLEQAAFAIALLRYPEMRRIDYTRQLDTMASMLDDRLRGCDNGYMVVRELNSYLIDQLGFQGCRRDHDNFYDPENSYMNRVMERRIGIPVTLSVIYILLGQRLRLPLFGVGIPTKYMLKYRSSREEFFINPFDGGKILNYSDCRRYLREVNVPYKPEYLEPISNRQTVARMMRNLAEIYQKSEPAITAELDRAIAALMRGEGREEG